MDEKTKTKFRTQAQIVKALAHPTRLFIIDQLSQQERCVHELTEMIRDDVSTVSKHLAVLKNAGIVRDRKSGTQVFYSLQAPCIMNFFSCVESVLKEKAEEQRAALR